MKKEERKKIKNIKNVLASEEDENEIVRLITQEISGISYSSILSQKIILKILKCKSISLYMQRKLLEMIAEKYPGEHVVNYIKFTGVFYDLERMYINKIDRCLVGEFGSLFQFMFCLGRYTYDNPEIIDLPKQILINEALKVLYNDVSLSEEQSRIVLGSSFYISKKEKFNEIYQIGIKIGCLIEKYDDVSFYNEQVVKFEMNSKPYILLKVVDWNWRNRLMFADAYYNSVSVERQHDKQYIDDPIYNYYKCYICKKIYVLNADEETGEVIKGLLERQFAAENMLHSLARHVRGIGDVFSYSLSIFLLLYIELYLLLLLEDRVYKIISFAEIKQNMFGAELISDEEFERVVGVCFPECNANNIETHFYKCRNGIIIGSWMQDMAYDVFEEIGDRVFSSKFNSKLGHEINEFGKNIFEDIVKYIANECGWKTLRSRLVIKSTDFDLLTFKDGTVILGQIKSNHCKRNHYSIWKANNTILDARAQIIRCREAIEKDPYLMYSNLKREGIVTRKEEIKEIIYVIISGNGYVSGNGDIPVLCIEDWKNLLGLNVTDPEFKEFLLCPPKMYPLKKTPQYRESIIETDEYAILYNELE